MSYETAMEKAGATIHLFKAFGSYQGDWYALVTWRGETGWIQGSYGSCSGCDAFEAEFGYSVGKCEAHEYEEPEGPCAACEQAEAEYQERHIKFGETYLESVITQEQAEKCAAENADWSEEDAEALEWLQKHRGLYNTLRG